jgi:hypothetical protein
MTDQLEDIIAIQMTVSALGLHVDARRWRELEALFVPGAVELDYTSMHGGEVTHPTGREVVGAWEEVLPGFTMTNHLIGPALVKVTGLRASAEASVVGWHWIDDDAIAGGNRWVIGGRYTLRLEKHDDRWRIAALKLTAAWQEGNKQLLDEAAKRMKPA